MRLFRILAFVGLLGIMAAALPPAPPGSAGNTKDPMAILKDLNDKAIKALEKSSPSKPGKCTVANATQRKDWARMSAKERKDYIKAVKCLKSLPAKSRSWAHGARTRFDDFTAVHINKTWEIHATGNFLTWHRYFTWIHEQTLKKECGYKGAQPYWNWFEYANDLTKSPVFDGSDTSLGGDGEFVAHNGTEAGPPGQPLHLPSGKGGGCVTKGPFAKTTINLGPVFPGMDGLPAVPADDMYAYNPRCLHRDLNNYAASTWMTAENLLNITVGQASSSITAFQDELGGRFGDAFLGMHGSGHYAAGGDASCFFSSTNDPTFFLHHAMVDRVYWLWQSLHLNKAFEVGGTLTMFNDPPSRNATTTDPLEVLLLGDTITIGDALSTTGGSFCYIYV